MNKISCSRKKQKVCPHRRIKASHSVNLKERKNLRDSWVYDGSLSGINSPASLYSGVVVDGDKNQRNKTKKRRDSQGPKTDSERRKAITQEKQFQRQDSRKKYRIEELLGLKTSKNSSLCHKHSSSYSRKKAIKSITQSADNQIVSRVNEKNDKILIQQNLELLKINQHLLYEKEYFRQKANFQEVVCRDYERKLNEAEQKIRYMTSQISIKPSKIRLPQQKPKKHLKLSSEQNKENAFQTKKSSLLISASSRSKHPLQEIEKEKKSNLIVFGSKKKSNVSENHDFLDQTEAEFSQLLESMQNENNTGRKMTLRKMLANKAMELKRIKGEKNCS